jgi:hypothetical protein
MLYPLKTAPPRCRHSARYSHTLSHIASNAAFLPTSRTHLPLHHVVPGGAVGVLEVGHVDIGAAAAAGRRSSSMETTGSRGQSMLCGLQPIEAGLVK